VRFDVNLTIQSSRPLTRRLTEALIALVFDEIAELEAMPEGEVQIAAIDGP
jgi:hypothetical protein